MAMTHVFSQAHGLKVLAGCWGRLVRDSRKVVPSWWWGGRRSHRCCPCSPTRPFLGVEVAVDEEAEECHGCLWLLLLSSLTGEQRPVLRRDNEIVWLFLPEYSWVKIWGKNSRENNSRCQHCAVWLTRAEHPGRFAVRTWLWTCEITTHECFGELAFLLPAPRICGASVTGERAEA